MNELVQVIARNLLPEQQGRLAIFRSPGVPDPVRGPRPLPRIHPIEPVPSLPIIRESAGHDAVVEEMSRLRRAVESVVQADRARSDRELDLQREHNPGIIPALKGQASEGVELLLEAVELALDALDMFVEVKLAPHADVPRRLETEGSEMEEHADAVRKVATDAQDLVEVENWSGSAADAYRAAAKVQADALAELADVMDGDSEALLSAAEANRAAMFAIAQSIRQTALQIEILEFMVPHSSPYRATNTAAGRLRRLLGEVTDTVEQTAEGDVATSLAEDLDKLLETPKVLQPLTWPSGTSSIQELR